MRGGVNRFLIFYKNRPAISRAEITDTKKSAGPQTDTSWQNKNTRSGSVCRKVGVLSTPFLCAKE